MSTRASDTLTITKSDIAELAGVGRSTVSNWIARHSDFPSPVDVDGSSPRFATDEVRAWLRKRDKSVQPLAPDRLLWNIADALRGRAPLRTIGSAASTLVTLRYVTDPESPGFEPALSSGAQWQALRNARDAAPRVLRSAMAEYVAVHPDRGIAFDVGAAEAALAEHPTLTQQLLAVLADVPIDTLPVLYDQFQDRLTSTGHRGYDEYATSTALVTLIAQVAASAAGPVHDPAVGSGRMLLAAGRQGEDRHRLTGQDISREACVQAAQRAIVSGFTHVTLEVGDVLVDDKFERANAGVVVADPPYGQRHPDAASAALDQRLVFGAPAPSNVDIAWLQIAIWHLAPRGRAFVLQPRGTASRGGAARKARDAMLKAGTVEALVALPPNLASHTSVPLHLWVLARPHEAADPHRVLLVDESGAAELDVDGIAAALLGWRDHRAIGRSAVAVGIQDILDADGDLTPERWREPRVAPPQLEQVKQSMEEVGRSLAHLPRLSDQLDPARVVSAVDRVPVRSVGELAKANALTVLRARSTTQDALASDGTPIVSGAWIRFGNESRRANLGVLSGEAIITRPGDVVVQVAGGLAARVDDEGGRALLSSRYVVLRPDQSVLDPDYLASALITEANGSVTRAAVVQQVRVQDFKVAVPPVETQRGVAREVLKLQEIQIAADAVARLAERARTALIEAVDGQVASVAGAE